MLLVSVLIFPFLTLASAQDANCDFVQNAQVGKSYDLLSPNYPGNYTPGSQCRWIAVCPTGYNCRLDCPVIALPQSPSCSMDRLLISRNGDPQMNGADVYCGRGSLTAVSTSQRISVGLISSRSSPGGYFRCQVTTQVAPPIPNDCRCGERKQNRIVGGQEAGVNEYRMMAGIADRSLAQIKCGGVIISRRHVLTAAHCVLRQTTDNIAVIVGEHDVTTGSETSAAQGYKVDRFIIHELYNQSNYDYDAAIVVTRDEIQFNENVGAACLPFKFANTNFTGAKFTILGWGTLFPGGPKSNVLQKVDVDVISLDNCRLSVPALTDRQFCTYTPGKDACQDDSGGPLLYTDPSTGLLFNLGLVSYGRSCASGSPGVNTRVTAVLNWIQTMTQATFCRK